MISNHAMADGTFAEDNSPVAESLFKLCERRQGIGGVKGNQLQLLTESDDVMQALIRDIQLARHNHVVRFRQQL